MIRRIVIIVLLVFMTGCTDFKRGINWEAGDLEGWKDAKKENFVDEYNASFKSELDRINYSWKQSLRTKQNKTRSVYISTLCNDVRMEVVIAKDRGSYMSFLGYIPIMFSKSEPPKTLRIHIKYPESRAMCRNARKDLFKIYVNGVPTDDFIIQPGGVYKLDSISEGNKHCLIEIGAITSEKDRVEVNINENVFGCKLGKLDFREKSYFCIKATEFGGSGYCGN